MTIPVTHQATYYEFAWMMVFDEANQYLGRRLIEIGDLPW